MLTVAKPCIERVLELIDWYNNQDRNPEDEYPDRMLQLSLRLSLNGTYTGKIEDIYETIINEHGMDEVQVYAIVISAFSLRTLAQQLEKQFLANVGWKPYRVLYSNSGHFAFYTVYGETVQDAQKNLEEYVYTSDFFRDHHITVAHFQILGEAQ